MGRCRFVQPDSVRIDLSDGDWIEVKTELNAGEERRIFSGLVKRMDASGKTELDPSHVGKTKLLEYIVAWSFVDANGKSVKFDESALDNLNTDTYAELVKAVNQHEERSDAAREEKKTAQATGSTSSSS